MSMTATARRTVTAAALCAALLLPPSLGCETTGAAGGHASGGPGGGEGVEPPAVVLSRFVAALEGGRWSDAQPLLSARWRAAYTPGRLATDFGGAGPLAREAVAHVRTALAAGAALQIGDGRALLAVAGGRALLVAEAGGWRVDALE
jgi:hypothetical protein